MKNTFTMKEIREEERPYEKCLAFGAEVLSDSELLSVIIRTGTPGESAHMLADRILRQSDHQQGLLGICHLSLEGLMSIKGIGKVKAIQIKCIAELARRIAKTTAGNQLNLSTPGTIADYLMEDMRHEEQEQLRLLMLNTKNRLLKEKLLFKGTVNHSIVSTREIFIEAVQVHAVHIVLVHNHPSGDPTPSREDILMTKRVMEAGELIGITLLDHIVIGDNRYVSLKEKGFV